MILYKKIEIDLDAERDCVTKGEYNNRQRKALLKLIDLFEQCKFQECINLINNKKAFPYNKGRGYSEKDHISIKLGDLLCDMEYCEYYSSSFSASV